MRAFRERSRYLLTVLLEFVLGIVLLTRPTGFNTYVISVGGAALIVIGVVQAISYFLTEPKKAMKEQRLAKGLIFLVVGVLLLSCTDWLLDTLPAMTVLYGILFFILGAVKLQWTVDFLRFSKFQWLFALIGAAVALGTSTILFLESEWLSNVLWT